MIGRTNVGGGSGGGGTVNNFDGLVDNTITTFTMPQGKTIIRDDLCKSNSLLTYANLQGATQIGASAFLRCSNAEIILPSTLISIGDNAFNRAGNANSVMELNCLNACSVGMQAFQNAYISKVTGKFTTIGENAFQYANGLQEVVLEECTSLGQSCFSCMTISVLTKLHININGPISNSAFSNCRYVNDLQINGRITSFASSVFQSFGANRTNPEQNILVLDFSNSTFKSIGSYSFSSQSSSDPTPTYMEITIPSTCETIYGYAFQRIRNSKIYFKGSVPTVQATTFNNMLNTTLFVPYQKANEYRTAANWSAQAVSSVTKGYADENTFTNGQTLPTINDEGYGLTWYSDDALTTQVTTVADATKKYYCEVGTTLLAYKIKSIVTSDCTVTISDGQQTYALNDMVLIGTNLTITSAATDPNKTQVYMLDINGTDYAPATSGSVTVASDISIGCLYYDGINSPFDSTLANNSWTMINIACKKGLASSLWAVGDTKTDSEGYTWKIVDLKNDRYAFSDGSGYTNCVFMQNDLFNLTTAWAGYSIDYNNSTLNSELSKGGKYFNLIDQELSSLVDNNKIIVKASRYNGSTTIDCTVGFFAPCYTELGGPGTLGHASEAETICNGVTMGSYNGFPTNTSTPRYRNVKGGSGYVNYWLRSRFGSSHSCYVSGFTLTYQVSNYDYYACACFAF